VTPERVDIPVAGGSLAAWRWAGGEPLVLAVHGITSNGLAWQLVAEALAGAATVVAPDLRGRAGSAGLPGPYGMAAHAADLVAVLDHVGAERVVAAGHSMGGFVAAELAAGDGRVAELVLVDGGVALQPPPGGLEAALGPAMARLGMTFPDRDAYRAFWRAHPAVGDDWSDALDAHYQHDLVPAPGGWRSSVARAAVEADGAELYSDRVADVRCPVRMLWTDRGLLGDPPGLYTADRLAGLDAEHVPGVNHYTIVLAERGARAVAAAILLGLR
jgi:pimeloyl-ACP methyl ester carboxylesterase